MAIIANLDEPYILDTVEAFQPLPIGDLIDVVDIGPLEAGLSPPYVITNRFPVPPTAVAFLTDVDMFDEFPIEIEGLGPPYIITGALYPESDFLEPTTGQIWPRIG